MNIVNLKLNGKDYKCTIGIGFLGEIIEKMDMDIDLLLTKYAKNPFKYVSLFAYHAIQWELEEDGKEIDFTLKEMRGWIDKEGGLKNTEMIKFSKAFTKYMLKDVPTDDEKQSEGDSKKK